MIKKNDVGCERDYYKSSKELEMVAEMVMAEMVVSYTVMSTR
jgi:hypothetical protein